MNQHPPTREKPADLRGVEPIHVYRTGDCSKDVGNCLTLGFVKEIQRSTLRAPNAADYFINHVLTDRRLIAVIATRRFGALNVRTLGTKHAIKPFIQVQLRRFNVPANQQYGDFIDFREPNNHPVIIAKVNAAKQLNAVST